MALFVRLLVSFTLLLPMKSFANEECIDTIPLDDGWGWNGTESCQIEGFTPTTGECVDPDGDGYGWNGMHSCDAGASQNTTKHPSCKSSGSDPDGDGWGWENEQTCIVHPICESSDSDPDGDGWGWENEQTCIVNDVVNYQAIHDECSERELGIAILYPDLDNDGFTAEATMSCDTQPGYLELPSAEQDCDDTNENINPDAEEIPDDGIDQNCSGFDEFYIERDTSALSLSDNDVNNDGIRDDVNTFIDEKYSDTSTIRDSALQFASSVQAYGEVASSDNIREQYIDVQKTIKCIYLYLPDNEDPMFVRNMIADLEGATFNNIERVTLYLEASSLLNDLWFPEIIPSEESCSTGGK